MTSLLTLHTHGIRRAGQLWRLWVRAGWAASICAWACACATPPDAGRATQSLAETPTRAVAADGRYISWREHIIDDKVAPGIPLTGGDGLVMGDLDGDGREEIVSVHESDTEYDGQPDGFVRIAFATSDPRKWVNITLAQGEEAAAPEDAAIGDVNGDGHLDVIVASELAHLIYFQNPGAHARSATWPRAILAATRNRGSFIRVFLADFDGDGRLEASSANKGAQNPNPATTLESAVSVFRVEGDALNGDAWKEIELGRFRIPQNAQPVDLDADGDMDILAGVRVGGRLILFENQSRGELRFRPIEINTSGARTGGFNLDFADINRDGRLDILTASSVGFAWLEQPAALSDPWTVHRIGDLRPDGVTGFAVADFDSDGDMDVIAGSYSRGARDHDEVESLTVEMGRLAWFQNPGTQSGDWVRHDLSRRARGMFDKFLARDLDRDGDLDILGTRGNSNPYDGVYWLEQVRTSRPVRSFTPARRRDSREMPLPP